MDRSLRGYVSFLLDYRAHPGTQRASAGDAGGPAEIGGVRGGVIVGVGVDLLRGEAARQARQRPEQAVGFGVKRSVLALVNDAVPLPECGGDLAKTEKRVIERKGGAAEIGVITAEQDAAVFEDAFAAEIAATVAGVGVEAGPARVLKGARGAVVAVNAVGAMAVRRARGVVGRGVEDLRNRGCVDDADGWVAVALLQDAAGEAEDAVTGLRGAADGRLADRERQQGRAAWAGWRSARSATTVRGEFVQVGAHRAWPSLVNGFVLFPVGLVGEGGTPGTFPQSLRDPGLRRVPALPARDRDIRKPLPHPWLLVPV